MPVVMALTYPGTRNPTSPLGGLSESRSSLRGVLEERNRWAVLVPLATMFVLNAANLVYVGPVTTGIMRERKHQGESFLSFYFGSRGVGGGAYVWGDGDVLC